MMYVHVHPFNVKPVDGHQGNIHSGATPPWLRDDEGTSSNTMSSMTFGPSLEEFTKHSMSQLQMFNILVI